jgi:hypothetical protein
VDLTGTASDPCSIFSIFIIFRIKYWCVYVVLQKMNAQILTLLAALTVVVTVCKADNTEVTVTTSADGRTRSVTSADDTHGWANYSPYTYTVTESPDGNTRTYDGTDYSHGWKNYSPDKLTVHYDQDTPASIPSPNRIVSRRDQQASQRYAQPVPAFVVTSAPVLAIKTLPSESVLSFIKSNRWMDSALIVGGTLTNTNAVPVKITNISATGFNGDQKPVIEGSEFTIMRDELAPGETVNFKVALKDDTKQIKFVKVRPYVVQP